MLFNFGIAAAFGAAFCPLATASKARQSAGNTFYKGHDLSSLGLLESNGATFIDSQRGNAVRPLEDILGDGGMNSVRLRLWVNPPLGNYSLNYTIDLASRFYKQGYEIYLDYHFSDNWADPGKQWTPTAWPKDLPSLSRTLRAYVKDTLISFKRAGVDLAIVSIGNEVTNGFLWPAGRASLEVQPTQARVANFTGFASLLSAARKGVDDAVSSGVSKPEIMLHLSYGWNATLQSLFYNTLTATKKFTTEDWDSFGLSFYPFNGTNAKWSSIRTSMTTLTREFGKPVHVVETDYPAICTTVNGTSDRIALGVGAEAQTQWVRRVLNMVRSVPNGLGRGVWYWEPAYITNQKLGGQCEDLLLFSSNLIDPGAPYGVSRTSVDMYLE